jgi:AraC-like DNA-binding protein
MSTEYWQNGSTRVLQLVESRLGEGQRDIIHDVLVYLMRQVLDVRAGAQEARDLRAESVAAFLGLHEPTVRGLFAQERLSLPQLQRDIERGVAGTIRRAIDVQAMLRNQLAQLRPQLNEYSQQEKRWQWLIDEVVQRLYAVA